jgi:hypothetical protein
MAHRPSHDPAKDVSPAFVGRKNAIADQKGSCPAVISDHSKGGIGSVILSVRNMADPLDLFKERGKEIGLVVTFHPLKDGRNPFQAHAGIDTGFGQRLKLTL